MEFSGMNTVIRTERLERLTIAAAEYLKGPVATPVQEEWVGLRPVCYDDLPIIGRSGRHENLILAAGHGSVGMAMAPATGRLVSQLITGEETFMDPSPFSPERFQSSRKTA
jgi:D-amino-acid dehydrogenase